MGRTACLAVLLVAGMGMLGGVISLEVTAPSEGLLVMANRAYTVEWSGTEGSNRYEIDLYYCGPSCAEDDCGEWVTALCPYGESGCPDNEGDYDIVMPEPMGNTNTTTTTTTDTGYKVRVMDVANESVADCSADFTLLASGEAAPSVQDASGPVLEVTAPEDGDWAYAGEKYTVEFDYNNGVGSSTDRFAMDLYMDDGGDGDCGAYVTSICDTPTTGCKDSGGGGYDVIIPEDTASGDYKIRVGRFEDDSLFGCSGSFEVVSEKDYYDYSLNMSYEYEYEYESEENEFYWF